MTQNESNVLTIRFPGDLEYIPSVRKFISEILQVRGFTPKFAYRTEIIVDELCNNAVTHGCLSADATVELTSVLFPDHVEFRVRDEGGTREDIDRLRRTLEGTEKYSESMLIAEKAPAAGLGLEIVRMLSEELRLEVDENDLMSIHVVRKREDQSVTTNSAGTK
jgi:anti-sigma regulatory factor (Ser/Thr protein kinase)